MPGNGAVWKVHSPALVRSIWLTEEVDQKYMAISPEAKDWADSLTDRFFISQERKIVFMVSSAFRPASPSKLIWPSLIIGSPWDHISDWKNQLPVMFQPQKIGSLPIALTFSQTVATSSQVVGIVSTPASFRMSML